MGEFKYEWKRVKDERVGDYECVSVSGRVSGWYREKY